MKEITYTVPENRSGRTLRDIIRGDLKVSGSLLTKLKKSGGILLSGKSATTADFAHTGDTVTLVLPEETSETIEKVNIPLDVVYEDDALLCVSKPKDMPTHPSAGNYGNTLANACMYYYRDTDFVFRPVNRLDRDTTGLVLIAKDARTSALLSESMQKGQYTKGYFALLTGTPEKPDGVVDAPIGRCHDSIIKREVRTDGQSAVTAYSVLDAAPDRSVSLALLLPKTGRTHQIRVHMAHIGHPLIYDYMYGTEIPGETLYLHCGFLSFEHPLSGERISLFRKPDFPFFKGFDYEIIRKRLLKE